MGVGFAIPNYNDGTTIVIDQTMPDAVDYAIVADAIGGRGVISGCAVTPTGTPGLQVQVAGGVVGAGGIRYNITGQTVACSQNTTSGLNRFVIIYAKTDGTCAAFVDSSLDNFNPNFPSYANIKASPNFACIVAAVWRPGGPTPPNITTPYIVPKGLILAVSSNGPLNPRMFGAIGDGVALDGTAVQTCETMCRTLGRVFDLDGGNYRMRNPARNGTDGQVTSLGVSTDPTTWVANSATAAFTAYDVGKTFVAATIVPSATTIVAVNSATQVRLSQQPTAVLSGQNWQVAFGAALLVTDMSLEASDASVPTANRATGDLKVTGAGRGRANLVWSDDPGVDIFGMPRYYWDWRNTLVDLSGSLSGFSIIGNGGSGGAYNPNLAPVAFSKGYGLRLPNRMTLKEISISRCHTGLVADGAINMGQYVTLPKTSGVNFVDIDPTISPAPPLTIIGMNASGTGIPKGSPKTVTAVTNIAGIWRITLSGNLTNVNANSATDLQIDAGNAQVQNTDHFQTYDVTVTTCRDGYLTKNNSGLTGGGGTGTADMRHHQLSVSQSQRAGIVCSENGYLRDITFDSLHAANNPIGFLKEGTPGIVPSQNTFLSQIDWRRAKSEGSATYIFKCMSRRSVCNNWYGVFEMSRGCAINGTKTHKFISNSTQHAIYPFGSDPSLGTPYVSGVNQVTATRTVSAGLASAVIRGALPTNPSVNVGDLVGMYSDVDASFNDCGVISAIDTSTSPQTLTVLVGAQMKQLTLKPFSSGDLTLSVDTAAVTGSALNVKNPDVGDTVTLSDGTTLVGVIDSVNFFDQTLTLASGAAVAGPGAGPNNNIVVDLMMSAQATPQRIMWGPIAAMDIGEFLDNDVLLHCDDDDSTQNLQAVLFWQIWNLARNTITLESEDFPSISITRAPGTGPNGEACATRIVRFTGECEVVPMGPSAVACSIGDTLEVMLNDKRQQRQATSGPLVSHGGIARNAGTIAVPTHSTFAASVFTQGVEPFVFAAREYVCAQTEGVNYAAALVEGGGVRTSLADGLGGNRPLVLDPANNGKVTVWDGTTGQQTVIGWGEGTAKSGRIDIKLRDPYLTATKITTGTSTLVAGTVAVGTTAVTANSRILLTVQSLGTVTVPKPIAVTSRVAGLTFTITSADATDTSVVAWEIIEP